jgi:menaquinol-cytochrome c reductase iron-sulfur subunit
MWSKKAPLEATATQNPTDRNSEQQAARVTRRMILSRIGLGTVVLALIAQAYAFLRSLLPDVLSELPQRSKIGPPDQFGEGAHFLEDRRVFIFREKNIFYAISAVCTHLGCTVKMQRLNQPRRVTVRGREFEEQAEFHCPCHGSKYYGDGTNYAGPAPRPLAYYRLEISPDDGQLIVDMDQVVPQDFRLTV